MKGQKNSAVKVLQNKVDALTNIIRQLLKDLQQLDALARGTITAFQLHIGEEEWNKLVEEMKDVEKRQIAETQEKIKKEEKKFETSADVE
jgi:DNA-directed RNA polymerase beta' subunit